MRTFTIRNPYNTDRNAFCIDGSYRCSISKLHKILDQLEHLVKINKIGECEVLYNEINK